MRQTIRPSRGGGGIVRLQGKNSTFWLFLPVPAGVRRCQTAKEKPRRGAFVWLRPNQQAEGGAGGKGKRDEGVHPVCVTPVYAPPPRCVCAFVTQDNQTHDRRARFLPCAGCFFIFPPLNGTRKVRFMPGPFRFGDKGAGRCVQAPLYQERSQGAPYGSGKKAYPPRGPLPRTRVRCDEAGRYAPKARFHLCPIACPRA